MKYLLFVALTIIFTKSYADQDFLITSETGRIEDRGASLLIYYPVIHLLKERRVTSLSKDQKTLENACKSLGHEFLPF